MLLNHTTENKPPVSFARLHGNSKLDDVFALRYQVYCIERRFLPEKKYGSNKESDRFDEHSLHFCAFGPNEMPLGTVRLVSDSRHGFPLENYYKIPSTVLRDGIRAETAEISRLAISKVFVRNKNSRLEQEVSSLQPKLILGLFKLLYQDSKRRGVTHWLAAMEETLIRILKRYRVNFEPIGPRVDYHGIVTPYLAKIADIEESVSTHCPKLFSELIEGLEPEYLPLGTDFNTLHSRIN